MRIPIAVTLLVAALIVPGVYVAADETAEAGRKILEAHKSAVVTVSVVIGISWGGDEQETESEANATIINEDGLAVLALSAVDPSSMFEQMGGMGNEVVAKVKDLKIIMNDGREVPAEIVLRDKDLDLAYVRPSKKPDSPLDYVDISKSADAKILDEIIAIGQLGKVTRRAHAAFLDRIEAVVDRPRTFYVPGEHRSTSIMCSPAFTMDGSFLGIGVMRSIRTAQGDFGGMGDNMLVVIVPASDIAAGVKQVPPFDDSEEPEAEEAAEPAEAATE